MKAARTRRIDLWVLAVQPHLRCLLLSPEQLSSKPFTTALSNPSFYSRIIALDIDEVHLILSWGAPGFRASFRDIGNVLMRLPRWTTLTGVTATLPAGTDTQKITEILGLKEGSFSFTRRSNHRPELQFIFRTLRHGLQGWTFPDFDWILVGRRKTIIYCRTISSAFRLFVYLWRKVSSHYSNRRKRFRLYCSLYSNLYNKSSRDMFVNDPDCQVLISTDALKVGNDFPNVDDVIVVEPEDPADVVQKGGRAGRKPPFSNPGPRCVCYFTQSTVNRAKAFLANGTSDLDQNTGNMTVSMACLILAKCIKKQLDIIFDNPMEDSPCTCETCLSPHTLSHVFTCICSGCKPEPLLPPLPQAAPSLVRPGRGIVMADRLSPEMREYGQKSLEAFRDRIWTNSTSIRIRWLPSLALLNDVSIGNILDEFSRLKTIADISPYVNGFLCGHEQALLDEIHILRKKFNQMKIGLDPDHSYVLSTLAFEV